MQTNQLIIARSLVFVLIKKRKRNCYWESFAVLAGHRVKMKEREKMEKYLDIYREIMRLKQSPKGLKQNSGGISNARKTWNHKNNNIYKIGSNTEKNSKGLRKLAVS